MIEKIKYDIGTKVRAKIHYLNDPRSEVDSVICGIVVNGKKNSIQYEIDIPPTAEAKKMGCIGSVGYVDQDDILYLCQ